MSKHTFKARLERPDAPGTWTYFTVPFDVQEVFGSRTRVAVKGTVNGFPYRSSLMPGGDGNHFMVVNSDIRQAVGVSAGDVVEVTMELDTDARAVTVPADFSKALGKNKEAKDAFEKLSYSHQKQYVDWIESAKKPETRAGRIEKALTMLVEGRKSPKS